MQWMYRVPPRAWLLVSAVVVLVVGVEILRMLQVNTSVISYGVQPIGALAIAAATLFSTKQYHDRARHHWEKAAIIASILSIWFVLYFVSGLVVTYVGNVLARDIAGLAMNVYIFIVPAAALEYVRYKLVVMVGRRHMLPWGIVLSVIFALYYVNVVRLLGSSDVEVFVQILFSELIPALTLSGLLTYLAVSSGLMAMMMLRVGVLITTIVPPIIPKYDWYLVGLSAVALHLFVYLGIDRYVQGSHRTGKRSSRHLQIYQNVVFIGLFIGLTMLMSGFFAYRPVAIVSNSMKPTFARGSMVLVERKDDSLDIKVGDIIQYEAKGIAITHRVTRINKSTTGGEQVYITQGDNNPGPDKPVHNDQITGVVRASAPLIGYPSVLVKELVPKS